MTGLCLHQYRWNVFKGLRNAIDANEGGLDKFSQGASQVPPVFTPPSLHPPGPLLIALQAPWHCCARFYLYLSLASCSLRHEVGVTTQ